MIKKQQIKSKTNVQKVSEFMEFGHPLQQAFVMTAITAYADMVRNKRLTLQQDMKDSFISPVAWIACADEWKKQNP
jgi:hypothetical protein